MTDKEAVNEKEELRSFIIDQGNLNETDADIYLYLLYNPPSTTKDIMNNIGKTNSPVHNSLKKLEQMGFIDRHITEGRRKQGGILYKPNDPEITLKRYITDHEVSIKKIKIAIDHYHEKNEVEQGKSINEINNEDNHGLWMKKSKRVAMLDIRDRISKSNKSILLFGNDCTWLSDILQEIRDAAKRNIEIKVVGKFNTEEGREAETTLKELKLSSLVKTKIKFLPFFLIDGKILYVIYRNKINYFPLCITNDYWVERFKNIFKNFVVS